MAVPRENILVLKLDGHQSDDELLSYIQAKQKDASIRQIDCSIHGPGEEISVQHPLFSVLQNTPTLEHVSFTSLSGNASIDAFLDAISQNESIHTVCLWNIDCSASAVEKLMERKIQWEVHGCRFIGHPSSRNDFTCNVEELRINDNDPSVMDLMSSFRSWPLLRQLNMATEPNLHFLETIILGAPILQEFTLHNFPFQDPAMLQSFATIVGNSPSVNFKCRLDGCWFFRDTMTTLKEIVALEAAKKMRVSLSLRKDSYETFRIIMNDSSCVGDLELVCYQFADDPFLTEMLQALQQQPQPPLTLTYPIVSVRMLFLETCLEHYNEVFESIPKWTPRVKTLRLDLETNDPASRCHIRTKFLDAVRSNIHLQSVELDLCPMKNNGADDGKKCRAELDRYCERNRKLQDRLEEADLIPLNVWPYIYHSASRGGADMIYRLLCQNIGYMLDGWCTEKCGHDCMHACKAMSPTIGLKRKGL